MTDKRTIKKPSFRRFRRRHHRDPLLPRDGRVRGDGINLNHPSLIIFPNLFTSASLFLSLFAIVKVSEGDFTAACWLILLAAVCDVIDGPIARLTRTASSFGLQFDSLADVVAFGVAPAFLMFSNLHAMNQELLPAYASKLALGACALYAICAAIRLARFNVQADTAEKRHFSGLPSPGAAGGVVTAYLFVEWLGGLALMETASDNRWLVINLHRALLVLMVGLALLMVSEIPFPKLKNLLVLSRKPFNTLVILIVVICVVIAFQEFLPAMLFMAFMAYTAASIGTDIKRKWKKRITRKQKQEAAAAAAD